MSSNFGVQVLLFMLITSVTVGCGSGSAQLVLPTTTPEISGAQPVGKLDVGSKQISDKDGMTLLYVPAGEFTMGSNEGDSREKPEHRVYLDAFWIDQTEVTNALYAKCVKAGVCQAPLSTTPRTRPSYYGNPQFDTFPVVNVARDYPGNRINVSGFRCAR